MRAGFIQIESVFGEVDKNLEKMEALIKKSDMDLLVLPELFNTGYLFTSHNEVLSLAEAIPEGKTTKALCRLAKEKGTYIVAGLAERNGDDIYNSAVLVAPSGYIDTYRKNHLFYEENIWFKPGDGEFKIYDIGMCKIGVMICFDWFFPESMRVLSLKGADIICHPANLVLPFCQEAMKTRCLENRVYAITANRTGTESRDGKSLYFTGKSQVMAPDATRLCQAGENTDEIQIVEVDIEKARDKQLNEYNDLFKSRRPELYRKLTGIK